MHIDNEETLLTVIYEMERCFRLDQVRDKFPFWKEKLKNLYIRETGDDPWNENNYEPEE